MHNAYSLEQLFRHSSAYCAEILMNIDPIKIVKSLASIFKF